MSEYQYQNGQYSQQWQSQAAPQSGQYPPQQYSQFPQYSDYSQYQQQNVQNPYQQGNQADQSYYQQAYQPMDQQYSQGYMQPYADIQYQQNQSVYQPQYQQPVISEPVASASKKPNAAMMVISRILVIVGSIILIASLVATIALVAPRLFGIMPYTVLTGSMEPAVPVGSLVYVKDAAGETLNKGDIVTFSKAASEEGAATAVTHRVENNNKAKSELTTKGDANDAADPQAVPYSNILGKVVLTVPVVGTFVAAMDTWNGKVAMIGIVIGGLIFCLVGDQLRRAAKRAARKAR